MNTWYRVLIAEYCASLVKYNTSIQINIIKYQSKKMKEKKNEINKVGQGDWGRVGRTAKLPLSQSKCSAYFILFD